MVLNKLALSVLFITVFAVLLFNSVHATGIGTSKVTLTQSYINVSGGSSANIGFTITLVNGTKWGTSLAESPLSSYITFSPSASNQDPTYSGTLTINVAKDTPPGKYTFNISATGDDPSTSPVQLTIYVSNSTTSTTTPPSVTPPSTTTAKPTNYFAYVGGIFLAILVILLAVAFAMKKKFIKAAKIIMLVSVVISLAAAAYLLIYDTLLRTAGMLHYDILIVFFILTIILSYLVYGNKKMEKKAALILGILSALFVLAMFLDAILGLPLTSISGSTAYGVNYLFGFGAAGTSSIYGISLAFSILLIAVMVTAVINLFKYKV